MYYDEHMNVAENFPMLSGGKYILEKGINVNLRYRQVQWAHILLFSVTNENFY